MFLLYKLQSQLIPQRPQVMATVDSQQEAQWVTVLKVNNTNVTFKIDTGAEVSAINMTTFKKLQDVQLKKPTRSLYGPAISPLTVLG